ncbi:FkbM family methyltransferase [Pelotalea chapellei]|uniref:FkbM family methyltransferase n=1 Tax=Pelotalea chapellei TaxID=44671 RepID=A0ABS5UAN5_9BACT|nr:FkbM family methyltransferase [Pelotalea chapellei]MBT1072718.1 FkbM family methyltransferase [Pelotalea chapellei]
MTPHTVVNTLAPGDLVFDVGANRGNMAEAFLAAGARVVCIEPQPHLAAVLRQRFAGNSRVTVIEKGLGSLRGRSSMSVSSQADILSTFAEHWKVGRFKDMVWDQQIEVQITTLDDLVAEFGIPRFCKIDVEGFEREVVKGLSSKIGVLSYEFTAEYRDHSMEVLEMLIRLGYRQFNVSLGDQPDFQWPEWVPYYEVVEALTLSQSPELWGDIYAR